MEVESNPVVDYITWRVSRNKNCIIVINGPTGSGKTYFGIALGVACKDRLKVPFSVKGNVGFSFEDLLRKSLLPENRVPGIPLVFDEAGVMGGGGASRDWQSKANQMFFSFLQTARHRNQILIFTCPHFEFLDKAARSMVHVQITMRGIDYAHKVAYADCKVLQVNPRTGKIYFKNLRFEHQGMVLKLKTLALKCPPEKMLAVYEKEKMLFTDALYDGFLDKKDNIKKKAKKMLEIDLNKVELYLQKGVSQRDMARFFGCSVGKVASLCKEVRERSEKRAEKGSEALNIKDGSGFDAQKGIPKPINLTLPKGDGG